MAEWIKWQKGLARKPEVLAIAAAAGMSRWDVAGRLMELWEWADDNTEDGVIPRATLVTLGALQGVGDVVTHVANVGWLVETPDGVRLPNFERHNGQSAKRRAQTALRVKRSRNARTVTDVTPGELPEKKRREKKRVAPPYSPPTGGDDSGQSGNAPDPDPPPEPDEALLALPDRIDRAEALAGWADLWDVWPAKMHEHNSRRRYFHALERGATPDAIIAGARALAASLDHNRFCPALYKWLAAERWTERPEPAAAGGTTGTPRPLKRDRASAKRLAAREELPVVYLSTIYMPDGELLHDLDFPSGKPPTNAIKLEDYL